MKSIPKFATLSMVVATMSTLSAFNAQSAELTVKVENLTQGIYFTPILIASHSDDVHLFQAGQMASAELQMMAEGGDISGLASAVGNAGGDMVENPASGLLAPAHYTMTQLMTSEGNTVLSLTAMMLPTNDGFIGIDNWPIPTQAGTYTIYVNGYDAGTEANDEIVNGGGAPNTPGIPASPGGNAGTGATGVTMVEANETVHIHRGNLGDDMPMAGKSDLDNTIHRWLNPVAKVTITVAESE